MQKEIIFHTICESYEEVIKEIEELKKLLNNSHILKELSLAKKNIKMADLTNEKDFDNPFAKRDEMWFAEIVFWNFDMVKNNTCFDKIDYNKQK